MNHAYVIPIYEPINILDYGADSSQQTVDLDKTDPKAAISAPDKTL